MKRLAIDISELCLALEDHSGVKWYFDNTTGEIFPTHDDFDDDDLPGPPRQELAENPERYLAIDAMDSSESYLLRQVFAEKLDDGQKRQVLISALEKRKPFSKFKEALLRLDDTRDEWFAFREQQMREIAHEWLSDRKIDYREVVIGPNK